MLVIMVDVPYYQSICQFKLFHWSPSSPSSPGEEDRAQGWRVLFLLLVLACIIGLAMIVVSSPSSWASTSSSSSYECREGYSGPMTTWPHDPQRPFVWKLCENFNQAKCALLVWNTQLHIHNSSSVSKTCILNTVPRILSSNVHQEIDDGNYRMGGGSVISRDRSLSWRVQNPPCRVQKWLNHDWFWLAMNGFGLVEISFKN